MLELKSQLFLLTKIMYFASFLIRNSDRIYTIGREFINVDLSEVGSLTFSNPDNMRFPALEMARNALKIGTQALIAYNASSEVAVQNFILKKISFSDIYTVMKNCLLYSETLKNKDVSNLYNILSLDEHIKHYASDIIKEIEVA